MRKIFNNNRFAIVVSMFATILIAILLSMSFAVPSVAYASDESVGEIFYAATGSARKETETFSYVTKTTESYSINISFPNYYNTNTSLQNTCANVAGANIIGYFDRYFENLIPNVTPGAGKTKYTYYAMTRNMAEKQAVINDLYVRMQTNVDRDGNTQTQYKNGITSYVQSKGLAVSYNAVMTNGQFDLNKAKAQFQAGNPISLYMSGYGFANITDNGSLVTLDKNIYDDNHIAIAYGYEKVDYCNSHGGLLRSVIYLKVATGLQGVSGVYVVNNYGKLNDAEAVCIK